MSNEQTPAADRGSECNDLLGQASEAVPLVERLRLMSRRGHWPLLGDEAADEIERLEHEASFYRRRVQALEQWQSRMRDPERTVVCDILANGFTLDPPIPRDRYEVKA